MIKNIFKSESLAIGLAMFSMFFGAGNVIFPLAVGQNAADQNFFACLGLILTAAVMPIAGVIAMILFDGEYRKFFGRLGKMPGFLLALIIISLLGPLGSTPRCIALSYTTLKASFPSLSVAMFSGIFCLLMFLFTVRKNHILTLLGWVLTPLLLGSLFTIILMGIISDPEVQNVSQISGSPFLHGLKEGYNTMDLLAAFFISSTIIAILKGRFQNSENDSRRYVRIAFKASLVGSVLLAIVYIGFSHLAAMHGGDLVILGKDELLAGITRRIAGAHAEMLVGITVALACLTTAIALISAFTDFVQKEVFNGKVGYEIILIASIILTFFISTFEFTGISTFLEPTLQVFYPGLIVLTFLNIAYCLKQFKPIKIPVFCTFLVSTIFYFA